ncbi:purine catabolism regulator [Rhodococcus wratislaviensis]|uniref:Transcriptional regulator n=1 Tax=Rhodococcus wratislaviensis TaxID=44752 RepID=A0AB38FIG7_RHOWR|nr:PucR family transcriptional regulator [Rhodococcus wratislaviensis]REE73286.1 purine catabolism regulator [Rhodococcus wratislaviensis]SPZ41140.1 transcriptional regulator [Rhodococcus wratislaviensis]
MSLTVRELLRNQFLGANPQVLAGKSQLGRTVRWVHSSEIYEISPLLSGDELLLTTGLGLSGVDPGTRRHYLREVGERNVAGVAIELGRTFDAVPGDMIEEAAALDLPLIALRTVVPFIELCQNANTEIISREVSALRTQNELSRVLDAELMAGNGVARLLERISEASGCPLIVTSGSGALVAAHGVDDDRAAWAAADAGTVTATIHSRDGAWGMLTAGPGSTMDSSVLRALLERSTASLGLALTYSGSLAGRPQRAAAALVSDLLDRSDVRQIDLTVRSAAAGFHPAPGNRVVAIAIDSPGSRIATRLLDSAAKLLGQPCLRSEVHASTFGLIALPASAVDAVGTVTGCFQESLASNITDGVTVVVGDPCDFAPGDVGAALHTARSGLRLAMAARRSWLAGRVVTTTRELAPELTLDRLPPDVRERMVATTIAPLVEWDRTHSSDLVRTLEVHLRHGCSATSSASALHLGRQSLYQRLERIRALLGYDPGSPSMYGSLLLALCANRLAT